MPLLLDRIALIRLLITGLIFGSSSLLVAASDDWTFSTTFFGILFPFLATLPLTIIYLLIFLRFPDLRISKPFLAFQYLLDSQILLVPIFYSSGTSSTFTTLYILLILAAALTHSFRFALTMSLFCCCLVAAIGYFEANGYLPGVAEPDRVELIREILLRDFVYFGLFVLLGLVPARIAEQMRKTDEQLVDMTRDYALAQELNRVVVEHVPSGIALLDNDGRVVLLNDAGKRILEANLVTDRTEWLRQLAQEQSGGEVEIRSEGPARTIGFSVTDLGGALFTDGRIVIFQDVTDRKRIEQRLEEQRRLGAIGQLSASLAHEIRNPLAAISNSTQMLIPRVTDDDTSRKLTDIQEREINRMEHLVQDFLLFARPDKAHCRHVALQPLITLALERLAMLPDTGDKQVALPEVSTTVHAYVDEELFEQAFGNVLLNGLQWAESGTALEVTVEADEKYCRIHVINSGPEVAAEIREHIFEPFSSQRSTGTGLGLAIAWSAARTMGGSLELVYSKEGRTDFMLVLRTTAEADELES